MQNGQQAPYSLEQLRNYAVNKPGEPVAIRQCLYDFNLYPTAGQTQLLFFQLPQGQALSSSPGAAALAKRLSDTNMTLSGQLPAPQAFLCESVEVHFLPGSVATANTFTPAPPIEFATAAAATVDSGMTDVFAVLGSGVLRFTIGSIDWLQEAELYRFPPKAFQDLRAAGYSTSATQGGTTIGVAHASGRPYYLDPQLTLMTSQNFSVSIEWPVAVQTPSGFNGRIGIVLDGVLYRLAQ